MTVERALNRGRLGGRSRERRGRRGRGRGVDRDVIVVGQGEEAGAAVHQILGAVVVVAQSNLKSKRMVSWELVCSGNNWGRLSPHEQNGERRLSV